MDLHHVFTGEAARSCHHQHQHLIEVLHAVGRQCMAIQDPVARPHLPARNLHHRLHGRLGLGPDRRISDALAGGHSRGDGRDRVVGAERIHL